MMNGKKIIVGMVLFVLAVVLTGCNDEGEGFVGSWQQETESEYPTYLNITYDNGLFHIDKKRFNSLRYSNIKIEGNAESETVLKVNDEFGSMRLENGKIHYWGDVYFKK